jgi:hypothetical protein
MFIVGGNYRSEAIEPDVKLSFKHHYCSMKKKITSDSHLFLVLQPLPMQTFCFDSTDCWTLFVVGTDGAVGAVLLLWTLKIPSPSNIEPQRNKRQRMPTT